MPSTPRGLLPQTRGYSFLLPARRYSLHAQAWLRLQEVSPQSPRLPPAPLAVIFRAPVHDESIHLGLDVCFACGLAVIPIGAIEIVELGAALFTTLVELHPASSGAKPFPRIDGHQRPSALLAYPRAKLVRHGVHGLSVAHRSNCCKGFRHDASIEGRDAPSDGAFLWYRLLGRDASLVRRARPNGMAVLHALIARPPCLASKPILTGYTGCASQQNSPFQSTSRG